ncbi:MAG: CCA tRNA nucleotidyltransferase, partial [Anaerolineae bacterium]|nr:CCA tRNA nucleotidyltransferase [Anaerolineae bacterium]
MELVYPDRSPAWHDLIYTLQDLLIEYPDVYLVGGVVRDALRERFAKDIDLATAGDGRPVARHLANALKGDFYVLDAARGVGRALVPFRGERWVIDVAQFRGPSLLADLGDRDFTVNALAVPLQGELNGIVDPLGGVHDLFRKGLRRCSEHALQDDPVRALRAVRQSLAFDLRIEPATLADVRLAGQHLHEVPGNGCAMNLWLCWRAPSHGADCWLCISWAVGRSPARSRRCGYGSLAGCAGLAGGVAAVIGGLSA